jgi:hypothetical protein
MKALTSQQEEVKGGMSLSETIGVLYNKVKLVES